MSWLTGLVQTYSPSRMILIQRGWCTVTQTLNLSHSCWSISNRQSLPSADQHADALLPCVWRRRRPVRRLCTAVRHSLSWWGGRWSTQHWGRSGRAPPPLRTPAAEPAPCPCPSPRSAARSMTPTWTTPPPAEQTHKTRQKQSVLLFPYSWWLTWHHLAACLKL